MKGNKHFKALTMKASCSRKSTRTKHNNKPGAPLKGAMVAALTFITTELELLKANNHRKTPYRAIINVVEENKTAFPWLNVNKVKNHLRKLNKQVPNLPKPNYLQLLSATSTGLSSLTNVTATTDNATIRTSTTLTGKDADSTNIGSRPKGTMVTYSIDLQERIVLTKDKAAEAFSCVRSNSKHQMKKAPRGALSSIVERVKQKYNIPAEVNISIKTVRSWAR